MARYEVTVFERIVHEYEYEVEADSAEEAKRNGRLFRIAWPRYRRGGGDQAQAVTVPIKPV